MTSNWHSSVEKESIKWRFDWSALYMGVVAENTHSRHTPPGQHSQIPASVCVRLLQMSENHSNQHHISFTLADILQNKYVIKLFYSKYSPLALNG